MTLRFTSRTLFLVTAISAVAALMLRTSDWLAAIGYCGSVVVVVLAVKIPRVIRNSEFSSRVRYLLFLIAGAVAWFAIVDWSLWRERCSACSDYRVIRQLRIGGIPVVSTQGPLHHLKDCSRLLNDLGMPCGHRFEREHLSRAWGLLIHARPYKHVSLELTDHDEDYNDDVSWRIRQFAVDSPNEARELRDRIVKNKDLSAMRSFIDAMKNHDTSN